MKKHEARLKEKLKRASQKNAKKKAFDPSVCNSKTVDIQSDIHVPNLTSSKANGVITIGNIFYNNQPVSLTKEEEQKLIEYERELPVFRKQKYKELFLCTPNHIRQKIVDQCHIDKLNEQIGNISSISTINQEHQDLYNKKNQYTLNFKYMHTYMHGGPSITNVLSTQEIEELHAQACLEEKLMED